MKSKLSFLSIPYVVWMALFVVAPIVMVVFYAFSSGEGGFTLSNFNNMKKENLSACFSLCRNNVVIISINTME